MLNSIILLGGLVSAFGLGAISPNQVKQDNAQFILENHKSVIYNDDDEYITLTESEVNNYVFAHLAVSFNDEEINGSSSLPTINYQDIDYEFNNYANGEFVEWAYSNNLIEFILDTESDDYGKFLFSSQDEYFSFTGGIILFSEAQYSLIKDDIELDIQANQPSPNIGQVMVQFVSILTDGIVSLGSGVANGIVSMASALFLEVDNGTVTGLSVFGGILAIFAGLALAIGITTKIYQWVTSLGN